MSGSVDFSRTVTWIDALLVWLAASLATTWIVWAPTVRPVTWNVNGGAVQRLTIWPSIESLASSRFASDASAVTVKLGSTMAPLAGDVIAVTGAVVSTNIVLSSRLGDPWRSVILPVVACDSSACATLAGVAVGFAARYSATAPATCGDACDVPLSMRPRLSPALDAAKMSTPGANRSTQLPKFEKLARASTLDDAATVIACG